VKITIFIVLVILFGQVSVVFGQEEKSTTRTNLPNECSKVISVSIINKANLKDAQISIIKDGIFSKDVYIQEDHAYFNGWAAAFVAIQADYSLKLIPTSSNSDITITLTTEKNPTYNGWTTYHYSLGNITSSAVVIYDANNIPDVALENLVRHEMGHALGLKHSTTISSIMYPTMHYTPKYISDIDLYELKSDSKNLIQSAVRCIYNNNI
jgi:hypothetical protein